MENQKLSINGDDFEDILIRTENSFGITFNEDDFYTGMTFDDFCKCIESKIDGENTGGCTSQQAFYKVKEALITLNISDKQSIKPNTPIADVLGQNRKQSANYLNSQLGIKLDLFEIPGYIAAPFGIICLISFIAMFFKWEFASGFGISIATLYVASKLTTNLRYKTVSELVNHLVIHNYKDVRRNKDSYNKNEIETLIKQLFLNICALEEDELSPKTILL
ncbi:hypothetical protein ACLI1A_06945 [Flavobacterium sp. RHBU_3]|uniref:hypothetical protein n=1 Tax=Flavobacterium sp. RHBU_3 TaxID=3391184 RepID=UPI0039855379